MTRKITDLEGRLAAAFKRCPVHKIIPLQPLPMGASVIGRYKMLEKSGFKPGELLFCKVAHGAAGVPSYAVWERDLTTGACFRGFYGEVFREVLRDFLTRIEQDGGL